MFNCVQHASNEPLFQVQIFVGHESRQTSHRPTAARQRTTRGPQGDGSYRAIPRKPLDKVTVREAVRLSNYSRDTIYRLYNSGFITGERQSPRRILIHVASLQAHILAARDPGFWTPERRLRYWGV